MIMPWDDFFSVLFKIFQNNNLFFYVLFFFSSQHDFTPQPLNNYRQKQEHFHRLNLGLDTTHKASQPQTELFRLYSMRGTINQMQAL